MGCLYTYKPNRNVYLMMKQLLLLCAVSALLFCANGCSSPENKPGDSAAAHTLRFWHFWSEPTQKEALKKVVAEFEKEYNCKVELTDLSWNDGKTKLFAAFNSNTAPDVVELGSDWVAQFSAAGVLENLSDDSLDFNSFADFSKAPAMYKGAAYAVPWVVDTRVLFYNKALLRKAGLPDTPPATMPALLSAAEQINKLSNGVFGFGANGDDQHRLYKKVLPFFWSNGGRILDNSGKPVINSPENIAALDMYLSLARAGMMETQRQLDNEFLKGNIGFWISGSWLLSKLQKTDSTIDYGVMMIPPFTTGGAGFSFAGGEYLAVNARAEHSDLAKKFARFMTDGKHALAFCQSVYDAGFPASKQYINDPYFQSVPYRTVFAEQLQHAQMTPVHPQWLDIEKIIEDAVVEALFGRRTAQETLNAAQGQIAALLAGNQ